MARSFENGRKASRPGNSRLKGSLLVDKVLFVLGNALRAIDAKKKQPTTGVTRQDALNPHQLINRTAASRKAILVSWAAPAASFSKEIILPEAEPRHQAPNDLRASSNKRTSA